MNNRIAIVGMEAIFGLDHGLDALDRAIFDGLGPSLQRLQQTGKKTRAGTKSEAKECYVRAPDSTEHSCAASPLHEVVDGALRSAGFRPASNESSEIPLIAVYEKDLPDVDFPEGRLIRQESISLALQTVQELLSDRKVPGALLAAAHRPDTEASDQGSPGQEVAAAILLRRLDQAEEDGNRIYSIIEAIASEAVPQSDGQGLRSEGVARLCRNALQLAGVGPERIGYLEISGLSTEEKGQEEIEGLADVYRSTGEGLTCALGDVKANAGDCSSVSLLARIIKAALCLYHRYIPALSGWTGPADDTPWEGSPFYVPNDSRPWFLNSPSERRFAAISEVEGTGVAHLVMSEEVRQRVRPNRYLAVVSPYCFPLAGEDQADLTGELHALKSAVERGSGLLQTAEENLARFQKRSRAAYALMVVGHNREELLREIEFMAGGIPDVFEKKQELKTPKGSFFTSHPLGEEGMVAFVYPGVGSAYLGLGQGLFHLFPDLYDRFSRMTLQMGEVLQEQELYPRTRRRLTEDEIWKREVRLRKDILTIGECGTGFFILFTMILRDVFKVSPQYALGYSLGEPGMLASLGVWQDPGRLAERFQQSPTFQERLSGPLTAVKQFWNQSENGEGHPGALWDSFTLQATPSQAREAIEGEERVYLTIINTPGEVVIAGEPESCKRVIRKIGCKHYPLGLDLAIHCDPTRVEYERIVDLYTLPLCENPGIKFYSSSCYKPIPLRSKSVAHSIAKAYSETVDFPRLVNQAYEDGARLFIELGSRKFCCNLIDTILEGKDHLAMAINVKGTKDQASLVRVLAQLVSHRVPVDLSPLY